MLPIQRRQTADIAEMKQKAANTVPTSQPKESKENVSAAREKSEENVNSGQQNGLQLPQVPLNYRRDPVTGRLLAQDVESCLRCIEKGLICTLKFLGFEEEVKCAACTRSNSDYCIRQRPPYKCFRFFGYPWNSPNYYTLGEVLSPVELEEILQEHFIGQNRRALAEYSYISGSVPMALPPFNGRDLPAAKRPKNFESRTWKDVLPAPGNKSAFRRMEEESKEYERREAIYVRTPFTSKLATPWSPMSAAPAHAIKYLQEVRRYPARNLHVTEYLADTGQQW
ncbi:uncharacterized protein F4812DRAFT_465235 [Daldinia caldariorum]|uniref:uncharacterized protein n=1 Tax=Daldinia caldariorum TaxID=326644 RepID=UPI002007430C|nr:uncharacterized protein F4812DRAFT_465235 [Daldinia caldariorum]KAI1467131.1 hypothetical protein F4812DRAFT_465235 [Daldinia caldariorum]